MTQTDELIRHDARQALADCMGVRVGDTVTVIYDAPRADQAQALVDMAYELGAAAIAVDYTAPIAEIANDRRKFVPPPPAPLTQAMIHSDAVIMVTDWEWMLHLFFACYEATAAAQRNGTKLAFVEQRLGAWSISRAELDRISNRVWDASRMLDGARELHVTAPGGTDIRVSIENRRPIHNTPIVRGGEILSIIPYYGELALATVESVGEGTIVFDGALLGTGVGPHGEVGPHRSRPVPVGVRTPAPEQPLTLTVRDGRCVDVAGGSEAAMLRRHFAEVPDADRIGEVAFGTSERSHPGTTARLGTAHFAFGDNLIYGGRTASSMHQNGVVLDASIQVAETGMWILRDGEWQL